MHATSRLVPGSWYIMYRQYGTRFICIGTVLVLYVGPINRTAFCCILYSCTVAWYSIVLVVVVLI